MVQLCAIEMGTLFMADTKRLTVGCVHQGAVTEVLTTLNPWYVSLDPSTEVEVRSNIRLLKREKLDRSRRTTPSLTFIFKSHEEALVRALASLVRDIWDEGRIPLPLEELLIVSISKSETRRD